LSAQQFTNAQQNSATKNLLNMLLTADLYMRQSTAIRRPTR